VGDGTKYESAFEKHEPCMHALLCMMNYNSFDRTPLQPEKIDDAFDATAMGNNEHHGKRHLP
jgi:hypothetical protein